MRIIYQICPPRLDTREGDGLIERKLTFDEESEQDKENLWLCTVKTSNAKNAGTDADVFMVVYGDKV